jgi:hypothetical protein
MTAPSPAAPACPLAILAAGPAAQSAWAEFAFGGSFRPATRRCYRSVALCFLRWLEPQGIGLPTVAPEWVERFLDAQDIGAGRKSQYRTSLRRFFDTMAAHGVVAANPADQAGRGQGDPLGSAGTERQQTDHPEKDEDLPTLAELKEAIRELDPGAMDDNPEMLDAGVVLLAGARLGTSKLAPISRFTGISLRRVAAFAQRLRANGVWTADGKTAAQWGDEEGGWVALLIDILIAVGMVECRPPNGGLYPTGDRP